MPIERSVGQGGVNIKGDVIFVQLLLNDWRARNGMVRIEVDGLVGPETIGAIRSIQFPF
jgi:hypothetical protein